MTPYHCLHIPVKTAGMLARNPIPTGTAVVVASGLYATYGALPFLVMVSAAGSACAGYMVKQFSLLRKPVPAFDPMYDMPDNFMIHHGSPEKCVAGCGNAGEHKSVINMGGTRHALHACSTHTMYARQYFEEHAMINRSA